MLNPGTAPIDNATPELAAANMADFAAAVADHGLDVGQPERDAGADTAGRFGFTLTAGDRSVSVLMPGVPLAAVRDMSTSAPCLQVAGEWWWWPSAVTVVAALLR